jgi:hypothetical protein
MLGLHHWQSPGLAGVWLAAVGSPIVSVALRMTSIDASANSWPPEEHRSALKTLARDFMRWRAYNCADRPFGAIRACRQRHPQSRLPLRYATSFIAAMVSYAVLFTLISRWYR